MIWFCNTETRCEMLSLRRSGYSLLKQKLYSINRICYVRKITMKPTFWSHEYSSCDVESFHWIITKRSSPMRRIAVLICSTGRLRFNTYMFMWFVLRTRDVRQNVLLTRVWFRRSVWTIRPVNCPCSQTRKRNAFHCFSRAAVL